MTTPRINTLKTNASKTPLLLGALVLLGAASGGPAAAQSVSALPPAASPMPPLPAFVPPSAVSPSYRLGAEDAVSVNIVGFPDKSVPEAAIGQDGTISLPGFPDMPPVRLAGKTTHQAQALLVKVLRGKGGGIVNPQVSVTLVHKRPQFITFYGNFARTGTSEYRPGMRIVDAIAANGGAAQSGDLSATTVTHKDGTSLVIDLSHPETKGDSAENILLREGDQIFVPENRAQITVVGQVPHPGSFPYKEDMTVLTAMSAAGGTPSQDQADIAHSTIKTKDGTVYPLNLKELYDGTNLANDVKLHAGDTITVPELVNKIYLAGVVGHPGYFAFKPGDRVLDALKDSVFVQGADLAKVTLTHVDKTSNTAVQRTIDVQKFLDGKSPKNDGSVDYKNKMAMINPTLTPGDILLVPQKNRHGGLLDYLGPLGSILGVYSTTKYLGL